MALDGGQQDNGGLFLPNGTQYMTQQLSTIPTPAKADPATAPGAAPQAVPAHSTDAAPPTPSEGSGAASDAAARTDPGEEISLRLEGIARREAKSRRAEVEHHERMASIAAKEKALEAKLAELDDALGDPVKYMLDKGKDPVEVAKRFAHPETEIEKRLRLFEEKDARREAEANARTEQEAQDREAATRHQVVRGFVSGITEDNSPHLVALYQAKEVPALVTALLDRPFVDKTGRETGETVLQTFRALKGRNPTNEEIRQSLEAEAESRATKIIEANRRRAQADVSQAPDRANPQSGPSGISNQHASVTTSGKSRKLSLDEKRREARRELTAALEAEAAERE